LKTTVFFAPGRGRLRVVEPALRSAVCTTGGRATCRGGHSGATWDGRRLSSAGAAAEREDEGEDENGSSRTRKSLLRSGMGTQGRASYPMDPSRPGRCYFM